MVEQFQNNAETAVAHHQSSHPMEFRRLYIRDIPVDEIFVNDLIAQIVDLSGRRDESRYICYVNAHVYNLARKDPRLNAILNGSAVCYADGASVVWAANRFGADLPGRITGADFLPTLIEELHEHNRRVFLLGGKPGVAERAAEQLTKLTPDFTPAGVHHGYFDRSQTEEVIGQVKRANPDLLMVGLGSPLQEHWIAGHLQALDVPLTWAVGALLDFTAGEEPRCPDWMGRNGLEWLYRLSVNPHRKALRYLLGNPRFLFSVVAASSAEWSSHKPVNTPGATEKPRQVITRTSKPRVNAI